MPFVNMDVKDSLRLFTGKAFPPRPNICFDGLLFAPAMVGEAPCPCLGELRRAVERIPPYFDISEEL